MHTDHVKRLQDWIVLPSIAAENRNYIQGAEYMAKLAEQAGFTNVNLIPTSGKPGVFGRLDSAAKSRGLKRIRRGGTFAVQIESVSKAAHRGI